MQVGQMNRYESDCCYCVAAWQSQYQLLQQVEALEVLWVLVLVLVSVDSEQGVVHTHSPPGPEMKICLIINARGKIKYLHRQERQKVEDALQV